MIPYVFANHRSVCHSTRARISLLELVCQIDNRFPSVGCRRSRRANLMFVFDRFHLTDYKQV